MSLIRFLMRNAQWTFPFALLTSILSGFGSAALVAMINQALNAGPAQLTELGIRFALAGILVLGTRTISQIFFMRLGQQAKAQLRSHISTLVADAPYRHLEKQGSTKGINILTQDLDTIVLLFLSLPNLFMHGAVIIGCLVYLGLLSWQVLLFAVVTIFLGSLGFHLANTRALVHLRGSRRREDDLLKHFRALFDGAKELKLHHQRKEAFLNECIQPNIEAVRAERTRGYVLYSMAASWGSFIFFAFIGAVLFVFSKFMPLEGQVMSGYAMIFLYMILPIEAVLSAIPNLGSAKIALERIDQLTGDLPSEKNSSQETKSDFHEISLKNVTHSYYREKENEVFTLGPINLEFRPGELIFIVGGNGSGKTTLAKLLVGLYEPETGSILLNGRVIDESSRGSYRQQFSAIFNDFYLFDNLVGLPADDLDTLARQLLEELQLSHKVTIKEGVFSTTELSQGQKKRLALLVSYIEDRPFYVFDEWAADQDPMFKDVFYKHLLPQLQSKGKTVVVISHDDRYFDIADRCIKLDYGQITSFDVNKKASAEVSEYGNVKLAAIG